METNRVDAIQVVSTRSQSNNEENIKEEVNSQQILRLKENPVNAVDEQAHNNDIINNDFNNNDNNIINYASINTKIKENKIYQVESTEGAVDIENKLNRNVNEAKRVVVMSNYVHYLNQNNSEEIIRNNKILQQKEDLVAKPIGIPIEIQGVECGVALVDPGATRSIMRLTKFNTIKDKVNLVRVNNMYVLGSTSRELPIVGKCEVNITSGAHEIGDSFIYVVDESGTDDIVCDLVLGRATLANSEYPLLDLTGDGALLNRDKNQSLPCIPCRFVKDSSNDKHQLVTINTHIDDNIFINTADIKSIPMSRKQQKKQKNIQSQETSELKYKIKIGQVSAAVRKRTHLSDNFQEELFAHLLKNINSYTVATNKQKLQSTNRKNLEKYMYALTDDLVLLNLLKELEITVPDSAEENKILTELFSTFVPDSVKKSTTIHSGTNKNINTKVVPQLTLVPQLAPSTTKSAENLSSTGKSAQNVSSTTKSARNGDSTTN